VDQAGRIPRHHARRRGPGWCRGQSAGPAQTPTGSCRQFAPPAATVSLIAGIDTGAFAPPRRALLDETGAAVHWEAAPSYRERFPGRTTADRLFTETSGIACCAGGVATLDFMLTLIERFHGRALALEVADALVHTPRPGTSPQRRADQSRETTPSLSRRLIALMERNLDFPLAPSALAGELGISVRASSATAGASTASRRCSLPKGQAAGGAQFLSTRQTMKDIADALRLLLSLGLHPRLQDPVRRDPRAFRLTLRRRQGVGQTVRPEITRLARRDVIPRQS
jgi:AraC family carnitine catabolism transcriptional activator